MPNEPIKKMGIAASLPALSIDASRAEVFARLAKDKNNRPLRTIKNIEIVLEKDPEFGGRLRFDDFAQMPYLFGNVPWDKESTLRPWANRDDSAIRAEMESEYCIKATKDGYLDATCNVSHRYAFNPLKVMLESLPYKGDGYIRQLLPDLLGCEDSDYNYEVMKLFMLGAVSRVYYPGCKFDTAMIIQGPQGCGKSTFLRLLCMNDEWFTDSLDSLDGKAAAEMLRGVWIVELAELKSLGRTSGGNESVKRFISAQSDRYRVPWSTRPETFYRTNVFAGTTNKIDFLQDTTGNRRFLVVRAMQQEPKKSLFCESESMPLIRAAWAEALNVVRSQGECPKLVLPDSVIEKAEEMQADAQAEDTREIVIADYLDEKRIAGKNSTTCVRDVWENALKMDGYPKRYEASEIIQIILNLGWEKMQNPQRTAEYGRQRCFKYCPAKDPRNKPRRSGVGIQTGIQTMATSSDGFTTVDDEELPFN